MKDCWRVNRALNAVALLATTILLGTIVVIWARSLLDADADPHGYVRIFGVFAGVLLLLPLVLLIVGARALRGRQRSGFGYQVAARVVVGVYAWPFLPQPGWYGIGLGAVLVAAAVAGLATTSSQPPASSSRSKPASSR